MLIYLPSQRLLRLILKYFFILQNILVCHIELITTMHNFVANL